MAQLSDAILQLIAQERYLIGIHAANMLEERGIMEWLVVAGVADGRILSERPTTQPNPTIEIDQTLADGTRCKTVWARVVRNNIAKLVTVHFYDSRSTRH